LSLFFSFLLVVKKDVTFPLFSQFFFFSFLLFPSLFFSFLLVVKQGKKSKQLDHRKKKKREGWLACWLADWPGGRLTGRPG